MNQWGTLGCGHRVRVPAGSRSVKCCDEERPVERFYGEAGGDAATFQVPLLVTCLHCGGPVEKVTQARASERSNAVVLRCARVHCHRRYVLRLELFDG